MIIISKKYKTKNLHFHPERDSNQGLDDFMLLVEQRHTTWKAAKMLQFHWLSPNASYSRLARAGKRKTEREFPV